MQLLTTFDENRNIFSFIKGGRKYLKRVYYHFFISSLLIFMLQLYPDDKFSANTENFENQIVPCLYGGEWCQSANKQQKSAILFPKKIFYLAPFIVKVRIQHEDKNQQMLLQFSMRGMQMVTNSFILKRLKVNEKSKDTIWQTEVVLPQCASNRKDWLVELVVKKNKVETSNFMITIW
ncbi:MAG: hypothetical protein ACC653_06630 [Gammaproteobacteria bacterium]